MEEVAIRQNKTGTMYELERLPQNRFSGFRKQAQEQFYDMLTCKLIELLCEKMLSVPAMREVLLISHLSRKSFFFHQFIKICFHQSISIF